VIEFPNPYHGRGRDKLYFEIHFYLIKQNNGDDYVKALQKKVNILYLKGNRQRLFFKIPLGKGDK
jgi:hypothetical protein